MDGSEYLDVVHHEATALLAAARIAGPSTRGTQEPGRSATDLVWHIGEAHDFWGYVVRERSTSPDDYDDPLRPEQDAPPDVEFEAVHTFAGERAAELHRVLGDAEPETPVWSWTPQKNVAFVVRRMAHETAVHRVDAEHAAGRDHRLDAELAADGIDEFLTFFLTRGTSETPGPQGSVHIHCSDAPASDAGEWTIRTGDDGTPVVSRDHAKADAALRGDAHDLLMVLWRRAPLDTLEVFGDRGLAEAFVARSHTA